MRNRFHALCPYFAMFPESFVKNNLRFGSADGVILDPFSGRGTTVFESLLAGRKAIGGDRSPVAFCLSGAKADAPSVGSVQSRIEELRASFSPRGLDIPETQFFQQCYSRKTLEQLCFVREALRWRTSRVDRMLAGLALGVLHGESHRSTRYLSNRMPRTISTKPDYSVDWWSRHKFRAPNRDVFDCLLVAAGFRYVSDLPTTRGVVVQSDARRLGMRLSEFSGRVDLVITSPPYLDVTNYHEDQWLRLWFLGGPNEPTASLEARDDRHRSVDGYWQFLTESWSGVRSLLAERSMFVIRIGMKGAISDVADMVWSTLVLGLSADVEVQSLQRSEIVNGQVHAFRPGVEGRRYEYDLRFRVKI